MKGLFLRSKKLASYIVVLTLFGGLLLTTGLIYINLTLPSVDKLGEHKAAIPSQILSREGEVLLESGVEKRTIVKLEEIPPLVISSFLAAEDDNFYHHSGVDYLGVLRALVKNVMAQRIVQGGSTITQQVAKSILLSSERSYIRKVKDILLAKKIEKKFSKSEILEIYLNQVYLGGGYYGVKEAVKGYFDKELSEVTVAEISLIAGLLVAPSRYSPYNNPLYAKERQQYVLKRMHETEKIDTETYEKAKNETLMLRLRRSNKLKGGHFTEWIRQLVVEEVGEEKFLNDGLTITTTLSWPLQKRAEEEILKGLKEIDKRQGFNGALRHLSEEEIQDAIIEKRHEVFKSISYFFNLSTDGEKIYEIDQSVDNYHEIKAFTDEFKSKNSSSEYWPGNYDKDILLSHIEKGENYEAIVLGTSNAQRLIYVSVGGVKGFIDYENFKWAHKREISEERVYWSYETRPSSIVKRGDVILVKALSNQQEQSSAYNYFYKEHKSRLNQNQITILKSQKFIRFALDQEQEVEGSLIALDPETGEVLAFVGGADFQKSQFNRAIQAVRQPGSAIKPFIYALALENHYTLSSILVDGPEALSGVDATVNWKPRNYDNKFKGPMTLRSALQQSRNVPTIKLLADLGLDKFENFINRIKLNLKMESDLSVALGSGGVNLLDLVSAYSIFPNQGIRSKPKIFVSVYDREMNQLPTKNFDPFSPKEEFEKLEGDQSISINDFEKVPDNSKGDDPKQVKDLSLNVKDSAELKEDYVKGLYGDYVYDNRLAFIMVQLLRGVIQNGTGQAAKYLSQFIGGKTGTTNNYVDAWFLGFSPKVACGVWTGHDNNQTMGFGETGSRAALPIWKGFMEYALKELGETDYKVPSGIVYSLVDPKTGKKPGDRGGIREVYVLGTGPEHEGKERSKNVDDGLMLEDDDYFE